jgi:hypothetical protein
VVVLVYESAIVFVGIQLLSHQEYLPKTLNNFPKTSFPTGTERGAPVFSTLHTSLQTIS